MLSFLWVIFLGFLGCVVVGFIITFIENKQLETALENTDKFPTFEVLDDGQILVPTGTSEENFKLIKEFLDEAKKQSSIKSGAALELENTPSLLTRAGQVQIVQDMLEQKLITKKQMKTILGITNLVELNDKLFGNEIITADDQEFILNAKKKATKKRRRKLPVTRRKQRTPRIKSVTSKRT